MTDKEVILKFLMLILRKPEMIDDLIERLNEAAIAEDAYDYGLPIHTASENLELAVIKWLSSNFNKGESNERLS